MTLAELKDAFVYGCEKPVEAVCFAPGRVNLIGEYINLNYVADISYTLSHGIYLFQD
jgi:galactokinase